MAMADHELNVTGWLGGDGPVDATLLADAIDIASDQGQITWLTETQRTHRKRIAAIVPVDLAEAAERFYAGEAPCDACVAGVCTMPHPWKGGR
jgi:hypothetical protein